MICAVIPTRYHPPELFRLLGVLVADSVCVHLIVDPHESEHRLHRMWNDGCDAARAHGATCIAVLNDDITILPGTLPLFAEALEARRELGAVHPDYTARWTLPKQARSIETERMLTGACFMFRAEIAVRFDESLHFWYGDQQFDRDLRAAGWGVGCVVGVPYRHKPESSTTRAWDYLAPIVAEDERRWLARGGSSANDRRTLKVQSTPSVGGFAATYSELHQGSSYR